MPAYFIADVEVADAVAYGEHLEAGPAAVAANGGTYVARIGAVEVLEGDRAPARLTVLKFDGVALGPGSATGAGLRAIRE